MKIEVFDNGLVKEDCVGLPHHNACRGILLKDGKYLVTRLITTDIYMFPGGGLEPDETIEECVVREVIEETGIKVKVLSKTAEITEYFEDSIWTNHYHIVEFVEDLGAPSLTDEEIELGLVTVWLTLEELLDILENNMSLHSHGPNIHNREFLGLMNSI